MVKGENEYLVTKKGHLISLEMLKGLMRFLAKTVVVNIGKFK